MKGVKVQQSVKHGRFFMQILFNVHAYFTPYTVTSSEKVTCVAGGSILPSITPRESATFSGLAQFTKSS
jgi:hypothetical protein